MCECEIVRNPAGVVAASEAGSAGERQVGSRLVSSSREDREKKNKLEKEEEEESDGDVE